MKTTIYALSTLAILAMLSACGTGYDPAEEQAVRDYIVAAELKEVDKVRYHSQLNYTYISDFFVTVPSRQGDYLVEFQRRCAELRRTEFTSEMIDVRDNQNMLRARFDTIRGCRIGKLYEISDEQRKELLELGDAPGENIFLPDEEQPE